MNNILEFLAATIWFWTFATGPLIFAIFTTCILFSRLWWIVILYCIWMWIDRKTYMREGRPNEWVRRWILWKYVAKYFSIKVVKEDFALDPKQNYLMACFPHGIMPVGVLTVLGTSITEFQQLFPFHKSSFCTLNLQFYAPLNRELLLSLGGISANAEAITYNLSDSKGGKVLGIVVGGAAESYNCKPNTYKLVLKNRKGFIRLALKTGTDILPVITFNETAIFDQFKVRRLFAVQELIRRYFTFAPVLLKGWCIVFPYKVPVVFMVGKPISVKKTELPSAEEINSLHRLFISKLTELFENHKHKYINNASNIFLEIV